MSLAFVGITLNIRNNRTYPIRINVLGGPYNPLDTANAKTEYRWDITAFTPSNDDVLTLEYKPVGAAVFSIFTYQIYNTNTESLIAALDALGIGYFQSYTELGQLYLSTYNDNNVFGLLTITNNGTPATSTTTTTTTAAPTTSTTTTSTTAAPTSTSTTTTTAAPTTSTTTTSTTAAPTSTTTTTTTAAPTTSTTTTTTTAAFYAYALGVDPISGNGACVDFTIAPINYYSASASLVNGVVLYQDPALSTFVPDNYYSDGIQNWLVSGGNGILTTETLCSITTTSTTSTTTAAPTSTTTSTTTAAPTTSTTTSTTTAPPVYAFCLGYDASSQPAACADYINCSASNVILNYYVGNQSGGELTIFNNLNVQLLNITSTAGNSQSGTIFPLISELPYTIRGEWVSGSGNIIQFNLCDLTAGGTVYTSGSIDNVIQFEDYLVTPTPINAQVNLTAQSVPLPICPA
jgi:hypothetical protein